MRRIRNPWAVWTVLLGASPAVAQMPVNKVVVAQAEVRESPATVTVVGTVHPVRRSRVSAEIGGLIESMPVRQGDVVKKGQVLCELKKDTLSLRLAEEEARLAQLKARHEELLAGTRKEDLARLKAILDEAVADFERWTFEMERVRKLYEGRDSNAKEYNDTMTEYRRAERRKIAAQASYDLALAGPRKEVIAQAAHAVAQQQAVVDRIKTDLDKTVIRAPFAGAVVDRPVEVGEWIDVGDPVVEMVDLRTVLVRVNVPETAFPYLSVGSPSGVWIDALQRRFAGTVKHIMPQADPNAHTFPVEVEVDNRDGLLASGMFARVTLPGGPKEEVVAVPKDAVVERHGVTYVGTVMPGRDGKGMMGMLMPVTLGIEVDNEWIAVTGGGLRAGMPVVVRGTERILPFPTPVEIVDERGTPVAMPLPRGEPETSNSG